MEIEQHTLIRASIEDLLLDNGIAPKEEIIAAIESLIEELSFTVAADILSLLIQKLDRRHRILWAQLLKSDTTLAEAAQQAGVSTVAIHRQTKRLEKRLMNPTRVE